MAVLAHARALLVSLVFIWTAVAALAQVSPFAGGWVLDGNASSLSFQSIKGGTKVESSSFAAMDGTIDEAGNVSLVVYLESVDTKIDLRNVRMRFLFFETFLFPQATITARIDPASIADLPQVRRKTVPMPYTLDLHGVQKDFETDVIVTLLSDEQVFVSSATPISVSVEDFALGDGLKKLEEAAGLPIVPSATVTFDFLFRRNSAGGAEMAATATATPAATPTVAPDTETETDMAATDTNSRALESAGNLALEECRNRFLTLSEANEIYFASGSSRLDDKSAPILDSLAEIIGRCPDLLVEVGGHTDSVGSENANQRLSERRAASVAGYLEIKGIGRDRIRTAGYGETRPIAPNDTERGRWRNRRIEFTIVDG